MKELFADSDEALAGVKWSMYGLDEGGDGSTFWLGTAGAGTQLHYDTYGWNLVAQIFGRKKWTLFAPRDTPLLYPTRVPYEESSVFSQVNARHPDSVRHPEFSRAVPYEVELGPGDVLHVPRHWWHAVESLDTSIAINLWSPHPLDAQERVREALVRAQ